MKTFALIVLSTIILCSVVNAEEYNCAIKIMIAHTGGNDLVYSNYDLSLSLLSFDYTYPGQWIDIYFVFYNTETLYFFPYWSDSIEKIEAYIPENTHIQGNFTIQSMKVKDLNFKKGNNYFAIGIAPYGTLDFLNEIEPEKLVYGGK